ncbi:MAG: DUF5060 domain-containing protein [Planctomycetota bacterium]
MLAKRVTPSSLCLLLLMLLAPGLRAQHSAEVHHPTDIVLTSSKSYSNPFMDVSVQATFQGPGGRSLTIPGFHDGGDRWIVRFSPTVTGSWSYATSSSDTSNSGLHGQSGTVTGTANTNPLVRGSVHRDPDHPHHFIHDDGSPFFFFGFEVDWLWAMDMGNPSLPTMRPLIDQVADHGFNLFTINVYAHDTSWSPGRQNQWDYGPPAQYAFGGSNDAPDHSRMNPAFFRHFDAMMDALLERGVQAHLMIKVYNKLVNWPARESAEDDMFWKYVVARYQAYSNVIWDTAKESYNVQASYSLGRIALIRANDAYGRLITVHDPGNEVSDDAGDFKSDQVHYTHYGNALWNYDTYDRPFVNIEYGYERGVEDLPTYGVKQSWQENLFRTWLVTMGGGYTNYYYSNSSWDLIKVDPEPPGWDAHQRYFEIWTGLPFWEMAPRQNLIVSGNTDDILCRAKEGEAYVVYGAGAGDFTLRIQGAATPLSGEFVHTETGHRTPLDNPLGNGDHALHLPNRTALILRGQAGPVARFTMSTETPQPHQQVVFDAGTSSSPNGSLVAYRWDFDGDGQFETQGNRVKRSFAQSGTRPVKLQVEDSSGARDESSRDLTVVLPGAGLLGQYFDDISLSHSMFMRVDESIDFNWGNDTPDPRITPDGTYSERWMGFVKIENAGDQIFSTVSNDGVRLWVGNTGIGAAPLIDQWNRHASQEDFGTVFLPAGWHPVRLEHYQDGGSAQIQLMLQGPGFAKRVLDGSHLRTDLSPKILAVDVTPHKFTSGVDTRLTIQAHIEDPEGGGDIRVVHAHLIDPTGQYHGAWQLLPRGGDLFELVFDNLGAPQRGVWRFGIATADWSGRLDVEYPLTFRVR